MAKFRKKARSYFSRVKRRVSRRSKFGSGVIGDMISGGIIGGALQFGSPIINSYIPPVLNMRPTTIAVLGGGVVAKGLLHKGGKFADAAVIIGTAMAVGDLMAGGATGTSGTGFAGE